MRVLGIDPGLGITGYGIIEHDNDTISLLEAGIIKTSLNRKIQDRLNTIHRELVEILAEYRPRVCILEELYSHYKHPRTAIMMAHARGVICLACGEKKIPIIGYSSKRIKKAIIGTGSAGKDQVQKMVQTLLRLKSTPRPDDVTDALALAIAHVRMDRIKVR